MQVKKNIDSFPVRYIKGVGPKKALILEKVGIKTASDLLYYLPRRYEDRSTILEVRDARPGENQAIVGKVLKKRIFRAHTGTCIFEITVGEEKSKKRIYAVWYNLPFMGKVFKEGQEVLLYGKVERAARLQINHPAFEILDKDKQETSLDIGRIVPIYSLTENLSQKYLRKLVFESVKTFRSEIPERIPTHIQARKKLVDSKFAIENIHFPYSEKNLEKAYYRLVFEEFFILQVIMALRRRAIKTKGIKHSADDGLLSEFKNLFDFDLTNAQQKCIKDIEDDMASDRPMYRLLQGDVGSGKTVVGMYAALVSARSGYQAAMMAPTEVLARQHYVTLSKTFMPLGLNVRLLTSGMENEQKRIVEKEIVSGEADIIIGTHSLIQEKIDYKNLGLVIIDEQHKFGVDQRKALRKKGKTPDTLIMTATPIPRSLVLTIFGDMDISFMKEKPAGREEVSTYWVGEEKREAVYAFVRDEIKKGHQAFIVYPRIKETEKSGLKSAEAMYEHLKKDVFPEFSVALVHGRMKSNEKEKTMKYFCDEKYDVLVATTVIEVGVDIPNVTVMLVEHAERYGLAQLHQLRGRIGRGNSASYCILLGEPKTDASYERLSAMAETNDGFEISEKDLEVRGPGEFLGTKQSGLPELRIGDIARDFSIMEQAREEAFNLIKEDPELREERNYGVKKAIRERFGVKW